MISSRHITLRSRPWEGQDRREPIWNPIELIFIDFKDGTFHPGDLVTFDVYDNSTKQIISRHTYTA